MARGGYRPGAGRPKGVRTAKTESDAPTVATKQPKRSPLEYMLDVMNDVAADNARRDRMAIAAAPFVHTRADTEKAGKKDKQAAASKEAAKGRFASAKPPRLVVDNGR